MPARATILFAHGSRRAAWREPFDHMLAAVRGQTPPDTHVGLAFLELCAPSFADAIATATAAGATEIRVLPLFMSGGGHVLRDLPPLVEQATMAHPGVSITVEPAIGEHPTVIAAIARIAARAT